MAPALVIIARFSIFSCLLGQAVSDLQIVRTPATTAEQDVPDCERTRQLGELPLLESDGDEEEEEEERTFLQTSLRTASHLEASFPIPAALIQDGASLAGHHYPHPPPLAAPPILMQIGEETMVEERPLQAPVAAETRLVGSGGISVGSGAVESPGFLARKAALELEDGEFARFQTAASDDRVLLSLCWLRCLIAAILGASTLGTAAYLALEGHKARKLERAAVAALAAFSESEAKPQEEPGEEVSKSPSFVRRIASSLLHGHRATEKAIVPAKNDVEGPENSSPPQILSELSMHFAARSTPKTRAPALTQAATTFIVPWSQIASNGGSDCTVDIAVSPSDWPLRATLRRPLGGAKKGCSSSCSKESKSSSSCSKESKSTSCSSNGFSSSNCGSNGSGKASSTCSASAGASASDGTNVSSRADYSQSRDHSPGQGFKDSSVDVSCSSSNSHSNGNGSNSNNNSSNSNGNSNSSSRASPESSKDKEIRPCCEGFGTRGASSWNSIAVTADIMDAVGLPPVFFATRVMDTRQKEMQVHAESEEGDLGGTATSRTTEPFTGATYMGESGHPTLADEHSTRLAEVRNGNGALAAVLTRRPDGRLQATRPSLPPWDLELSMDSEDYWVSVARGGQLIAVASRNAGADASTRCGHFSRESCLSLGSLGKSSTTGVESIKLQTQSDSTSLESTLLLMCIMSTFFLA